MIFAYGVLGLLASLAILFTILVLKVGQARRASKKSTCYYCGSAALHVSSPKGLADRLLSNWHCVPYRCEVCFRRHYRFAGVRGDE
ncbi:MAG: hypothetical protein ACLP59_08655 [Bryobacteraceae bacterium]